MTLKMIRIASLLSGALLCTQANALLTIEESIFPKINTGVLGFANTRLDINILAQIVMEPALKFTRIPLASEPPARREARYEFDQQVQLALTATKTHLPQLLRPIYECMNKGKLLRLPTVTDLQSIYSAYECQKAEAANMSLLLEQLDKSGPLYPPNITEAFDREYNQFVVGDYRRTLFKIPATLSQAQVGKFIKYRRIMFINEYAPTARLPAPITALGFRALYCEKTTGQRPQDTKYNCGVLLTPANQNLIR
jgi:hypothetical protein